MKLASRTATTRAQKNPGLPIYRRILVVVDGSEDSIRAGEHAVYLAQSVGAELIVLGVVGIDPRLAARRGICFVGVGPDLELERRSAVPSVRWLAAANGVRCSEWRGTPSWEIVTKRWRRFGRTAWSWVPGGLLRRVPPSPQRGSASPSKEPGALS